jgi:hypothetical protein
MRIRAFYSFIFGIEIQENPAFHNRSRFVTGAGTLSQKFTFFANRVSTRNVAHSAPHPAASLVRPRSCRALSVCRSAVFSARSRVAPLSPSAFPPVRRPPPSHAPLARRPLPFQRVLPAAPVRAPAATASFCALACHRVVALCCCAAISSRRAHSPYPCRPRRAASGVATLFCATLYCCCCCRAAALCWARRAHSHFTAHSPRASPRTPRTDRAQTAF